MDKLKRSRALSIAWSTAALIAGVVVLLRACSVFETPDTIFRNHEDAVERGAIGPGKWLPSWLPQRAQAIHEAHNIDSNQVWLEFKDTTPLRHLGQECRAVHRGAVQAALPGLTPGFPLSMHRSREQLGKAMELDAVRCAAPEAAIEWIAVRRAGSDLGSDLVYAWTVRTP